MWDIDIEEDTAEDPSPTPAAPSFDDDGWGDDEEILAALPDPEVEAAAKKREEEEREAERQRREAAEKQRKLEKQEAARLAKEAKASRARLWDDGDDESGLFSVETATLDSQYTDFKAAADLFGDTEHLESAGIDIGKYVPNTVAEFEALKNAIVEKVGGFPEKIDRVKIVQAIITALADDYSASQLRDIGKFIADLQNARLGKKPKTTKGGAFMAVSQATRVDQIDGDDFM
jgi:nucleoid DNA-binding protein